MRAHYDTRGGQTRCGGKLMGAELGIKRREEDIRAFLRKPLYLLLSPQSSAQPPSCWTLIATDRGSLEKNDRRKRAD
jgi:hypothetical protein